MVTLTPPRIRTKFKLAVKSTELLPKIEDEKRITSSVNFLTNTIDFRQTNFVEVFVTSIVTDTTKYTVMQDNALTSEKVGCRLFTFAYTLDDIQN